MNDRFKFRVWDKLSNIMTYNFMMGNFFQKSLDDYEKKDWIGLNYEPEYICFTNEAIENLIIMQCTGSKDKNGKLIYEGDIIQIQGNTGKAKVEYNLEKGMFLLVGKKFAPSAFMTIRKDYWEVIGNIYENPELLQECE